ncbi:uncharacterized protein LOC108606272 isoform X2 [Drosophila busckii]|uniref:uncharacterized protein LOC108606272 isoform X2 n=1 Tax=Drosophila busckii TaxID=30019 RepID=UPI00083ED795|nr:uncharacterized protein LOC108606272 isoform X2 [Drosophila busckii]
MAEPGSGKNYPITSYEELLLHRQMCRQEKRKEQKRLKRQRKALAAQSDWRLSAEQRKHMRKDIRQTRRELRADRKQERAERRKRRAEAKQKAVAVARCSLKMQELCLREEMPQSAKSNELPKVAAATRGMTQQLSIAGATNKPRIAQIVAAQPPLTESSRETLLRLEQKHLKQRLAQIKQMAKIETTKQSQALLAAMRPNLNSYFAN